MSCIFSLKVFWLLTFDIWLFSFSIRFSRYKFWLFNSHQDTHFLWLSSSLLNFLSGSHLLSHTVSSIVSSAAYVLTFVFGMRTGVPHKRIATRIPFSCSTFIGSQQPNSNATLTLFLRKEVIQPHLPIRLPCYDFTPVTKPAFGSFLLTVGSLTSGIFSSHGVTGGVYKTRERIHRSILICDY